MASIIAEALFGEIMHINADGGLENGEIEDVPTIEYELILSSRNNQQILAQLIKEVTDHPDCVAMIPFELRCVKLSRGSCRTMNSMTILSFNYYSTSQESITSRLTSVVIRNMKGNVENKVVRNFTKVIQ